ncbi:MAG: ABC transporter substrate-binding protein [Proteobacteria bacterium]|nr:ABC transporter substrate-binding protein [Pseudomonadota bacterium]
MKRRSLLLHGLAAAAAAPTARAQAPAGHVPRVAWLGLGAASPRTPAIIAYEAGFRQRGWVPGQSLILEYRWAYGEFERLDALARDLVAMPVDVLFTPTAAAAVAARNATATIPIVFANVRQPVDLGLVASLSRPGANITGLASESSAEIVGKQLQFLREVRQVSRLAILWNPGGSAGSSGVLAQARHVADQHGVAYRVYDARVPADIHRAFQAMQADGVDTLLVLSDPLLFEQRTIVGRLATQGRLTSMFGAREDLPEQGLLAYGASRLDQISRAPGVIDRILRGTRPSDIPVELPTRYELIVNVKTASALGVTVPVSILAGATEIVE